MVSPPIWMRSPGRSWRSSTRSPFRKVPFVLRRSRSTKLPFTPTISACRREASALGKPQVAAAAATDHHAGLRAQLDRGQRREEEHGVAGSGHALPLGTRGRALDGGRQAGPAVGPPRGKESVRSGSRSGAGLRRAPRAPPRARRGRTAGPPGRRRPAPRPPRGSPSKAASTLPSGRLRTQPATPLRLGLGAGRGAEADALHAPETTTRRRIARARHSFDAA